MRRLHRMIDTVYKKRIKEFDLKGSMLSILFIIGKNKGINQKELADRLVLDQSTMSRDIKRLVDKGWVLVSKAEDTRYSELEISKAGYKLLEEVSPVWERTHKEVEALLGSFSIQQLDNITIAIQNNIGELNK